MNSRLLVDVLSTAIEDKTRILTVTFTGISAATALTVGTPHLR
ncbi:MAG: hypothetical protein NTU53_05730 [Planctomycetota bacterium]|nr:hypothetical protein [Planctomycetota bacterium]